MFTNTLNSHTLTTFFRKPLSCIHIFVFTLVLAASINSYAVVSTMPFNSSGSTYSPVSGGTVLGTTTNDEQVFIGTTAGTTTFSSGAASGTGFPIGFNFIYNGVTY